MGEELCSFSDATCLAVAFSAWRRFRCPRLSSATGFFLLSFRRGLILKLLLLGVLVDRLVALDAVECSGLCFPSFASLGESCWCRAAPIRWTCCRAWLFSMTCETCGFLGRFSYATSPVRCRGLIPSLQEIYYTRSRSVTAHRRSHA